MIESENVFDIYSEHEFGPEKVASGTLPVPWLRLSVIVKEEGTFHHLSRTRRLSVVALPIA